MIIHVMHWSAFGYYVYLFGYASLFKVFQKQEMMKGMEHLGFNKIWTLAIGYGELLGVLALIVGLWLHQVKNAAVIYLLAFAIGALMVHLSHKDYSDYYDALFGVIAGLIILWTDEHFQISL
jgi:uncharacterized membrane protein YphA (DoxX/SURF4 family)